MERVCTKCGATKPLAEFYADARSGDGRRADCKACNKARAIAWYSANREKVLAKKVDYYIANRPRERARSRAWIDANPERHNAHGNAWGKAHPENRRARVARRRARLLSATVASFSLDSVLWRDGYRCYLCAGDVLPDDVEYDHVVPLTRGGEHSYDNVRVTHSSCNRRKHTKLPEEYLAQRSA